MPQKPRTVHAEDAQDERLAAVPLSAAHTYAYLPTVLDDDGRTKDSPAVLNGYLWPLRADAHPTEAMEADLAALADAGLICRYTVANNTDGRGEQSVGRAFLHDPRWRSRQKASRPAPSSLPPCPVHEKSFEEAVTETLGRFADQVNTFVGTTASRLDQKIDQKRIQDSFARIVEDVTFLVDPEKAATNGQKVRSLFAKVAAGERGATRSAPARGADDETGTGAPGEDPTPNGTGRKN